MKPAFKWTALALVICLPLSAQAHRAWMQPSATVLSGDDSWITVDAAVSNDLFYFEHVPLLLEGIGTPLQAPAASGQAPMRRPPSQLQIIAPDGSSIAAENGNIGHYRTTFDVQLKQKGTYKLAVANSGLLATWKDKDQPRRWMGKASELANNVPANAADLKVTQSDSRMETFVTSGNPTRTVLKPTNQGLELVPITHPNDLFAGETAEFSLLIDGKPAKNLEVNITPGGNRYRSETGEIERKTDEQGKFSVTWPVAGMYWLQAETTSTQGVAKPANERRASYSATLEVLAP
ncbi:DUF4198 domain-containing protein [Azomonas macrocytogenes]|uniref:Putative GH25 family protein n=1 Tax=Azomonas macrocytogenes TaxID=69962 RepID=A0A839T0X6_AZOMA|nr:DUF4198 domain-containing protein [Azomonas macrocytogenes]MBB3102054.1 putative GH25 family protein [Azomonas macrocytogenes]